MCVSAPEGVPGADAAFAADDAQQAPVDADTTEPTDAASPAADSGAASSLDVADADAGATLVDATADTLDVPSTSDAPGDVTVPPDVAAPDIAAPDIAAPDVAPMDALADTVAPDAQADVGIDASMDDVPPIVDALADAQPDAGEPTDTTAPDASSEDVAADTTPPPPELPKTPIITELMASNDDTLEDEDGDHPDWVELHNPMDFPVNLAGYHLTDDPDELGKWTFPARVMAPGSYLVVFASDKDRAPESGELHANFKLDADGETVAVTGPALQIIDELSYPLQVEDISYGVPTSAKTTPLIIAGSSCRYRVPSDGKDDAVWMDGDFDDAAWVPCATGVGFETAKIEGPPVVVADSVKGFSGKQGKNGWWYGYWDGSADPDGAYAPATDFEKFPSSDGEDGEEGEGEESFWTGSTWDWPKGNPPWTELNAQGGHPNGTNTGPLHWAIRRWVSDVDGTVRITGTVANPSANGDGVVCRILVDGQEILAEAVDGTSVAYQVFATLTVGATIDFTLDPGPANNDGSDGSTFTARIEAGDFETPAQAVGEPFADSVEDWSATGTQGEKGWSYGYYDRTTDPDATYAADDLTLFPRDGGGYSPTDFWTGSAYDWYAGNPPWTYAGQEDMHPNGVNNKAEHWVVRRHVAEVAGTVSVEWSLRKSNPNGGGVSGHLFHNGLEVDSAAISGADTEGVTRVVPIFGVQVGDTVDLALDPTGAGGDPKDGYDASRMSMRLWVVPDIDTLVETDVEGAMFGKNASITMRLPFWVDDPSELNRLLLRVKYDDGFVAWLNGQEVARANAPDEPTWNAVATADHPSADAVVFEDFDLTQVMDLLQVGPNVLAIQGLNVAADDGNMVVLPVLEAGKVEPMTGVYRYFSEPTPGAENGTGATNLGPLVDKVTEGASVGAGEDLVVTAKLGETLAPVAGATLTWRVMFGDEVETPMTDDGTGGDEAGGDAVYTAVIPSTAYTAGQMVRWFVTAKDVAGTKTRMPPFPDPLDSDRYYGTAIADPTVVTDLPLIQWFVEDLGAAGTSAGTRTSLVWDGELYDNLRVNVHGQSTKSFPKKSYNVDFNRGHRFRLYSGIPKMKDLNLLTNWADKSKVRNTLAYETHGKAGSDYHLALPVRVQRNGQFFAIYDLVEDGDDRWLERLGRDPNGALYKMYDGLKSTEKGEKKTREGEDKADLQALLDGLALEGDARRAFIYDHVNIPAMVNYMAGMVITAGKDCCHKNYYAYRDTNGTGEWWYMPWDADLTFGRNWTGNYYDDTMYSDDPLYLGKGNNTLIGALYALPEVKLMYHRRVRTLMDALLQPPGTPAGELLFEKRIDDLVAQMGADAQADYEAWYPPWGQDQPIDVAVANLKQGHLAPRRVFLYETLGAPPPPITTELVSGVPGATLATYHVPLDDGLGAAWTEVDFDDSGWDEGTLGIGYELATTMLADLIATTVIPAAAEPLATTVFVRIPFVVDEPAQVTDLLLRMRYEDGFVAHVNGHEVARRNVEGDPTWHTVAAEHPDADALSYEAIPLDDALPFLRSGENILAIRGVVGPTYKSLLVDAELTATELPVSGYTLPPPQGPRTLILGDHQLTDGADNPEDYLAVVNPLPGP